MKRRLLATFTCLFLVAVQAPAPVMAAAPVIDQYSNTVDTSWMLAGKMAQTITVGKTGRLAYLDLWLHGETTTTTIRVSITGVNAAGLPFGLAMAQGWVPLDKSDPAGFAHIMLSQHDFVAGQKLAIVIYPADATMVYKIGGADHSNPYHGGLVLTWSGSHWVRNAITDKQDVAFRTWVVVPTPTPTPSPTPHPAATPAPHQTTAAPNATSEPTPTATPTAPTAATPASSSPPTELPSANVDVQSAAPSAGGSPAAGSGNAGTSGGSGDSPVAIILAAVAVLAVAAGLVFFFLLRRRRRQAET